jgi:hypothetical protein
VSWGKGFEFLDDCHIRAASLFAPSRLVRNGPVYPQYGGIHFAHFHHCKLWPGSSIVEGAGEAIREGEQQSDFGWQTGVGKKLVFEARGGAVEDCSFLCDFGCYGSTSRQLRTQMLVFLRDKQLFGTPTGREGDLRKPQKVYGKVARVV